MTRAQAICYLDGLVNVIEKEDWGEHDFIEAIQVSQAAMETLQAIYNQQ